MLSEIREELVKRITITLMLDDINEELIKDIKQVVTDHPGNVTLNFRLLDPESSIGIQLFSRTYRISVSNDLVKHLNNMDINYKVN
jgi:DNA polymerase-3 subunit alpha